MQISQRSDHSTELFYIQNNQKEHIFKMTYRKLRMRTEIKNYSEKHALKSCHHFFLGHPVLDWKVLDWIG